MPDQEQPTAPATVQDDQSALVAKYSTFDPKAVFTKPGDKRTTEYQVVSYVGVKVFPVLGQKHAYIISSKNPGGVVCVPCSVFQETYKPKA